ncbi:MAG: hypothetical protein EXS25_00140 [Pedosphaera sp.]|nr:hypothetical protein [Pedosphaera sp.]
MIARLFAMLSCVVVAQIFAAADLGEFGDRVIDYLNYRPHVTAAGAEVRVLKWAQAQGVEGIDVTGEGTGLDAALRLAYLQAQIFFWRGLLPPRIRRMLASWFNQASRRW